MTSSDGAVRDAAAPRVIAAGHLHPGMLFLRFLDGVRQSVFPVVVALLTGQPWLFGAIGVYFVLAMGYALARYLTFEYRLTEEELVTTEGILHRQERRIPVNRIQDLSFVSTLVRRICGLVVVSVETASSQGSEATLDSLSRRDADNLREALYLARQAQGDNLGAPPEQPREQVLFQVRGGDLFFLGLTDNRIGVILAALFGIYELASELGISDGLGGAFGQVAAWLGGMHWIFLVTVLLAVAFIALLGGWVVSVAASYLMFHNFSLTVRDEVFQRRFGLITKRAASLPRRRIQRVTIDQTFLRRILRLAVLRADSAGAGMSPQEETRGGRDVIVPLAEVERAEALVPVLLPVLQPAALQWRSVSRRVIVRITMKGSLLAVLAMVFAWPAIGLWSLLAIWLLPISYGVGVLSYQNLAFSEDPGHLALRWGILGRYRALVPLRKVQGVTIRRNPLDRLLGLARLTLYVAGGSPTTMSNLPRDQALRLQGRLVRQAAASRFVW